MKTLAVGSIAIFVAVAIYIIFPDYLNVGIANASFKNITLNVDPNDLKASSINFLLSVTPVSLFLQPLVYRNSL